MSEKKTEDDNVVIPVTSRNNHIILFILGCVLVLSGIGFYLNSKYVSSSLDRNATIGFILSLGGFLMARHYYKKIKHKDSEED